MSNILSARYDDLCIAACRWAWFHNKGKLAMLLDNIVMRKLLTYFEQKLLSCYDLDCSPLIRNYDRNILVKDTPPPCPMSHDKITCHFSYFTLDNRLVLQVIHEPRNSNNLEILMHFWHLEDTCRENMRGESMIIWIQYTLMTPDLRIIFATRPLAGQWPD